MWAQRPHPKRWHWNVSMCVSVCVCVCVCVCVALQSITEITLVWESALRQETAIYHLLTHFLWIHKHITHHKTGSRSSKLKHSIRSLYLKFIIKNKGANDSTSFFLLSLCYAHKCMWFFLETVEMGRRGGRGCRVMAAFQFTQGQKKRVTGKSARPERRPREQAGDTHTVYPAVHYAEREAKQANNMQHDVKACKLPMSHTDHRLKVHHAVLAGESLNETHCLCSPTK